MVLAKTPGGPCRNSTTIELTETMQFANLPALTAHPVYLSR
jgi:hypothetical protein